MDSVVDSVSAAITASLDVVAPLRPVKRRTFTLTQPTLELIREKRRARRLYQRHPNSEVLRKTLTTLSRRVADAVATEKRHQWRELCNNLDYRNGSAFWKQFKRLSSRSGSRTNQRVLDPQGNMTTDDSSTAQTLADHLATCHRPNTGQAFDGKVYAEVTNMVRNNSSLF